MQVDRGQKPYIMALDAGTTSERALIFDHEGKIVAQAQHAIKQIYPKPGWVEHDPAELISAQLGVMTEVQFKSGIYAPEIAALGITNQRETTLLWDKTTGKPFYNAIVWQCRRTAGYLEELKRRRPDAPNLIADKTGLILDPYFSASKIRWILDEFAEARACMKAGNLAFGTVDSWLIYKLTGGEVHATDYTNASRSLLFNIYEKRWDEELLDLFELDASILPEVQASASYFGETSSQVSSVPIPIMGVAGDQQASLFGHTCFEAGELKNTYGTGCFILMNTGDTALHSNNGLLTTLAINPSGEPSYALEGSVFIGGAVLQWLKEEMKILEDVAKSEQYACSLDSNGGVYIVPAFSGLGAPYWNPEARGLIYGLTRGSGKAHLIRAALESMAYQSADVIEAMRADYGNYCGQAVQFERLSVDGGSAYNRFCMQFQADVLNCRVERPALIETTAAGAAYLAGLSCGYWKDAQELRGLRSVEEKFEPIMPALERAKLRAGWRDALRRAL